MWVAIKSSSTWRMWTVRWYLCCLGIYKWQSSVIHLIHYCLIGSSKKFAQFPNWIRHSPSAEMCYNVFFSPRVKVKLTFTKRGQCQMRTGHEPRNSTHLGRKKKKKIRWTFAPVGRCFVVYARRAIQNTPGLFFYIRYIDGGFLSQ